MRDLSYLNEFRIDLFGDGQVGDKYNGAFALKINGEKYKVIASDGQLWDHVSISHKHKIPSWKTMCILKEMFFGPDEIVIQFHPRKSEYINNHPNCLHLWRPQIEPIPTPPKWMVGI